MNPLLVVTQPRSIPECMDSFAALDTPVAYIRGFALLDVCPVMAALVEETDHDPVLVCADDCIVTQGAVDAVLGLLAEGHPVVTGWCRLDRTHEQVNLSTIPLADETPAESSYRFPAAEWVRDYPDPAVPTYFAGMALTGMSRDMWLRFPLDCYSNGQAGWGSDYHLSRRLGLAGIPIVAAREGYVDHVKEVWMRNDLAADKRLLIGEIPAEVVWQ